MKVETKYTIEIDSKKELGILIMGLGQIETIYKEQNKEKYEILIKLKKQLEDAFYGGDNIL